MSTAAATTGTVSAEGTELGLHRKIDWTGAFWVASGVPALVLFSIGGIAATVGKASWLVWTISIIFGFIQSFTYAEIAGLFPGKSGGASIYGAVAWVRYAKFIAPTSVWCNWFAWSPVLAIGSPLGSFSNTVTEGIVGATGRNFPYDSGGPQDTAVLDQEARQHQNQANKESGVDAQRQSFLDRSEVDQGELPSVDGGIRCEEKAEDVAGPQP